jgi:protein tyrosine/serine phosphatase
VFVDCLHGSDRTGLAVASYRVVEQGWDVETAIAELREFGFHARYFPQILRYLRRLDAAKVREKMKRAKPVRIRRMDRPGFADA